MNRDPDPTPLTPRDPEPRWESDIDEREARRRKMLVFGGSAAAVLLGFIGLYAGLSWVAGSLTDDPTDNRQIDPGRGGGVAVPVTTMAPAIDVAAAPIDAAGDLDWYAIEAPLGHSERLFATPGGTFYALSTVPGQVVNWPPPKAIYKSGDGENWEVISLGGDTSATDMAVRTGAIYLIGTAPGTGNFGEPAQFSVSTTTDDGATWESTLLPTAAEPPGGAPVEWAHQTTRIAATESAVVAVAQSQFFLDYESLVPPEFAGYSYNQTADGVNVIDHRLMEQMYMTCEREMEAAGGDIAAMSEECRKLWEEGDESMASVSFVTWEEMGLPDGGSPLFSEMFVAADGLSFEAVQSPFTPGSDVAGLYGTAHGFVGVEANRGVWNFWRSEDGRAWHKIDGIPGFGWVNDVGSFGDQLVIIGDSPVEGAAIAWEDDSGGWTTVNFDAVLGAPPVNGGRYLSTAGVGPMGVVAVFMTVDERTGREATQVALGTSPEDWSLVPLDEITGMSGGYSSWAAVGTDQIMVHYQVFNEFRQLTLQVMGVRTN